MITLEKLLTELKAESLNEIVAGGSCGPKPKKPKHNNGHHSKGSSSSSSVKNSCGCTPPPPPPPCGCPPGNSGCQ